MIDTLPCIDRHAEPVERSYRLAQRQRRMTGRERIVRAEPVEIRRFEAISDEAERLTIDARVACRTKIIDERGSELRPDR